MRYYGLVDGVCKSCGSAVGILYLYSYRSGKYVKHVCRCRGCGRYVVLIE